MTASPRIETVVLDLAGTTVVDDGLVEGAFARAWSRREGPDRAEEAMAHVVATMGQSKIEVFRALLDENRAQELNTAFEAALDELVAEGAVRAIAGAAEVVRALRGQGRAVAFTTGFSRRTADAIIGALGWDLLADLVLTPADAGRGRPAPDLNLTALIRTGASSVAALAVVGDTGSDVRSGVRAGAGLVVAVMTGGRSSAAQLREAGADEVIATVAELPALLDRLGR